MTWQKCPVCDGRGTVSPGFYSGQFVVGSTSTEREECRSCHGKGVLLDPMCSGPHHYTISWEDQRWLTHHYAATPRYGVDWVAQKQAPGLSV